MHKSKMRPQKCEAKDLGSIVPRPFILISMRISTFPHLFATQSSSKQRGLRHVVKFEFPLLEPLSISA